MSEVIESVLDTKEPREAVPASSNLEINSEAAKEEEAEKAGASTAAAAAAEEEPNKHEERKERKLSDDSKLDKLDELSSLEQEIAKMHNIQHSAEESDHSESEMAGDAKDTAGGGGGSAANGSSGHKDSHIMDELAQATRCTPDDAVDGNKDDTKSATTLEEVDLIALLKGTDQPEEPEEEKPSDSAPSSIELALAKLDNVGVTIEGEGQYEIMEIDDGDNASVASPVPATQTATKPATKYSSPQVKPKLSPEQARAVALEQMADLKSHTARRKEAAAAIVSRHHQHLKPLDIISSLNDDWNEYDSDSTTASNSNSNSTSIAPAPALKKPQPKASSQHKPAQPAGATSSPSSSSAAQLMSMGSVKVLVKSVTQKSTETLKTTPSIERASSNPESTGFKRTRVIKRKIIWDPDAPETQKSFAQYAKGTTPSPTAIEATTATPTPTATTPNSLASKKVRPSTPKDPLKVAAVKRTGTPSKLAELNNSQSPPKRRSQTPSVPNGGASTVAKKKKVSEIDRLMGDEGAANMMQAVEREQRELSGGELPNKPLMRKRSLTMTGRKSAETQPATPGKKETPPKGGKRAAGAGGAVDAVFNKTPSKKRPSDSWDYVYKQRASEESMIMRRRSNSSYSSNASVNRLSLDNKPGAVANLSDDASDPSFEFLKPENKANQRNDAETPPPQTLTNDLKRGAQQQQQQQQQKDAKAAGAGGGKTELITVTKLEKVAQVFIHPPLTKTGHNYKQQLLQKLTETLNKLAKSNDCNTVLLCVQGQQFCQGIDCQELIAATIEKRKANATQVATVLKTYLRTLATFPKPLLAGIVGNLNNLGVMQLPLLDYVVAAEDCTYASSYARLGQLPEGYALWQQHPKVSSQVHSRLFLLGERLHTADLLTQSNRFVDKCCEASRVNAEALAVAKLISSSTAEHFRAIKKLNQSAITANLQRLDTEFNQLTEQWPSASFQANYKRYVNELQDI